MCNASKLARHLLEDGQRLVVGGRVAKGCEMVDFARPRDGQCQMEQRKDGLIE